MKPILTIHTATYNRAYILEKAYRSLQKQTEMNFEWLITDDGSTDGTEELVDGWIKEQNPFNIRYIKLEHQGAFYFFANASIFYTVYYRFALYLLVH